MINLKMNVFLKLLLLKSISFVVTVPHNPTSALAEELKVEFATMKNSMKLLSDQWEKWNTLFITSLEPRITSTASTLASIDSNIHNLQERAHVWDTFQLHVTAWNEQLASLDRKMDIISKGQEKLLTIDNKVNIVLAMEYKLDKTIKALNNIETTLTNFDETLHTTKNQTPRDGLFNEFTTRGVLSSIKAVERKLDKLLLINQNKYFKSIDNANDKPKLQIKCSTPKFLEELIKDISSKVDVIFDSFSSNKNFIDDTEEENDYLDITEGSGNSPQNSKMLKKTIRKAMQPCKQTNDALEEILTRTIRAENIIMQILDKEHMLLDLLNKEISLRKLLDNSKPQSADLIQNINIILDSYFNEQRVHFENLLSKIPGKCVTFQALKPKFTAINTTPALTGTTETVDTTTSITHSPTPTVSIIHTTPSKDNIDYDENSNPTWKPVLHPSKSSCEDLTLNENSGVYIFQKKVRNNGEIFSNKRYCEIREDGLWTVIQRRDNYTIQHNFNVSWDEYKTGFGDLHKDFWMGNELLYELSKDNPLILRIELDDFDNNSAWAEYSTFKVGEEIDKYKLIVSGYSGNASDALSSHNGSAFSTYDNINDQAPECCPCSVSYGGGWWFNRCFESNLNGIYYRQPNSNGFFKGLIWEYWLGNYSLKKTTMMVKSRGKILYHSLENTNTTSTTIPYFEDP